MALARQPVQTRNLSGLSTMSNVARPCASMHEDDASDGEDYTYERTAQRIEEFFPDVGASPESNESEVPVQQSDVSKQAEQIPTPTPITSPLSAPTSANIVTDVELVKLCSMLEIFHVTPPATCSELPLEDAVFDQDEPALNQKMWDEILGADYLSGIEPINDLTPEEMLNEEIMKDAARALEEDTSDENTTAQPTALDAQREHKSDVARPEAEPVAATHAEGLHTSAADDVPVNAQTPEEDALSDYSLNSLFDEVPGETSAEQTHDDAAPESAVTPGTPPNEQDDVTDEESDSDYSLDLLFNDAPDEHKDATTAVDASAANTPTEAEMAIELSAKDDAPAGHEASTMSPPTQEGSVDDRQNDLTPSEGEPTDNQQEADAPSTDVALVSETAGHASAECTPVKAPLEMASPKEKSEERASSGKAPAPTKHSPIEIRIEYGPAQNTHLQNAPLQSAPVQDTAMEDQDELNQNISDEKASAKDDDMKYTSAANAPTGLAPINVRMEYAYPENAPGQITSVHEPASKDAEVLEDAPLEEAQAEDTSAEQEEEEYDPENAPIDYALQSTKQTPLEDIVLDDAPAEDTPIEQAPTADVPMDDAPKEDTNMPDALTTTNPDPADVLKSLSLLPQPLSTPHNDFIKAETAQSPSVSPLSSPPSSPPPQKGLRQLVTASRSAATLQARKRKVEKGRHSVSPPAKKKRLGPATTAKAPVPRSKRRQGQGVSARGGSTRRMTTRSVTAASKLAVLAPAPAPPVVVKQPTPPSFPTTPLLGKRKAYTGTTGNSPAPSASASASANKRRKLSPPPAPAPTRRKTAIPTVTARHTRSMGPKCLLYSADILALERGLRRGG